MPLFPTFNTLQEVVDYAESRMPVIHRNEMISLLMILQNTLLKVLEEEQNSTQRNRP